MEVPGVAQVKRLGGMITGVNVKRHATFQVGNILLIIDIQIFTITYISQQNLKHPAAIRQLMGGVSASSHSHLKAKSTMSAPGIGHFIMMTEMAVPGVAQVKRLEMGLIGLTVEKDAPFKVGNTPLICDS